MTGISNDVTYSLKKTFQKINRLPLKYYESRTTGEILSRVTNDGYAAERTESERDAADYFCDHTGWRIYYDAEH